MEILVIEDDAVIGKAVQQGLSEGGPRMRGSRTADTASSKP